jgi:hypothetical protein
MNDLSIPELKSQIEQSNNLLAIATQEIENLQSQAKFPGIRQKYKFYKNLLVENHKLIKNLQKNVLDIRDYKTQLNELQKNLEKNNNIIQVLSQENQKLKMKLQSNKNQKLPEKKIRGASDLRQSFGFNLKKHEKKDNVKINNNLNIQNNQNVINEEENEEESALTKEQRKAEFEKLKIQEIEAEKSFRQKQQMIINYSKQINAFQTYNVNYSNYINSINNQIRAFNQQARVSVVGEEQFNFYNLIGGKIKQLMQEMEATSLMIKQVDDNIHSLKIRTLKKAENIITSIDSKLSEINKNKNLTYYFLSVRMDSILNSLDDLKKIVGVLQQNIIYLDTQRKQIEKCINNLKINIQKFMQSYQEGKRQMNEAIRKTLRKTGKTIFNGINKSIRNEKDEENEELYDKIDEEQEEEAEIDDNMIRGSTLIGINDFGKNIELFKSKILFQDKNINEENKIKVAKILRKNWHEICYIYDDYDMHDVHFEIKAVGLGPFSFFNSCSVGFYMGKDIEILVLEINGKKSKFNYGDYCLDFSIKLSNLQSAKIYLKYKERPIFNKMTQSERLKYPFFRQEYYGLSQALSGQMGKYSLILKGSFEIISFKEDFFIHNEQNKKEKEYIWGGKVPPEGKRTLVKLSKNEAIWKFSCNTEIVSRRGELKNTVLKVPLGFVGGNNDIIKMDYSSPQTKNIVVDEENRIYEIKYKNSGFKSGDFKVSGEIKNRCKGEWEVDLTDEIIESHFPKEDKRDKAILEPIARKIIEEFDKNNKDTMFNFMDYAKIGKWVHKNIKYDLNYSGRTDLTAMDIYKLRVGVCHHMTRLANALLYSLGYKVIYTNGFACESSAEFDQNSGHAWSLIQVNGKWYPFDATWNILSGKLPVCHVFQGFFGKSIQVIGTDGAIFGKNNVENGKFIK